jgi:hypothetical protein
MTTQQILGMTLAGYTIYVTLWTASEGEISKYFLMRIALYLLLAAALIFASEYTGDGKSVLTGNRG